MAEDRQQVSANTSAKQHNGQTQPRTKRTKYAPVACNECKKRKLKCDRDEGERDCQRCLASRTRCTFSRTTPSRARNVPPRPSFSSTGYGADRVETRPPCWSSGSLDEVNLLREQLSQLRNKSDTHGEIDDQVLLPTSLRDSNGNSSYSTEVSRKASKPQEPLFVGHTRSAFALGLAKSSLADQGISPETDAQASPASTSISSTREPTPDRSLPQSAGLAQPTKVDPILSISTSEIMRLIDVYQDEIGSMYPLMGADELVTDATHSLRLLNERSQVSSPLSKHANDKATDKDVRIIKVATASALVIEANGKNELSQRLVDSVEAEAAQVTRSPDVDLRDLQLLTMMSIYFFHCDEDLLAWRTIGIAARMALEMGLHRKQSVLDNYRTPEMQDKALRTFWCVYALDRRWSFGTGLSFALNDRDIDFELPEPGDDYQYLRCLIGYGRLCAKVWEALPPYGSAAISIPLEQVQYLEFLTHNWLDSIPPEYQLQHPRLGFGLRSQPRTIRRLRTLLYLRGNHMRTLIHRHHVSSPGLIQAHLTSARLVVDIAKDTIRVLVDLAETSDVYARQQSAFNYFLLGALAVLILGVCNAPKLFADSCREIFSSSTRLLRNFSKQSHASKRLWKSVRGLLPAVQALRRKAQETRKGEQVTSHDGTNGAQQKQTQEARPRPPAAEAAQEMSIADIFPTSFAMQANLGQMMTLPDTYEMSSELMGLFDAFGQTGDMVYDLGPFNQDFQHTPMNMRMSR